MTSPASPAYTSPNSYIQSPDLFGGVNNSADLKVAGESISFSISPPPYSAKSCARKLDLPDNVDWGLTVKDPVRSYPRAQNTPVKR
jgi:hypothetical protein